MPMPMVTVELALINCNHTANSWTVKEIDKVDHATAIFLPKSKVEIDTVSQGIMWDRVSVTMPEWLAKDRGLV